MKKIFILLGIPVVFGGLVFFFHKDTSRSVSENTKIQIQENFGKIPLYFEKNEGQAGDEIDFISRGQGYGFYVKSTESFFQISDDLLKMTLKGANEKAKGNGLDKQEAKINYFTGNDPGKWKTGISTYAKVKYDNVYPGIDLVYYGNQKKLEYDFVVAPQADYEQVTLQFEGAEDIKINDKGDLVLMIKEGKELVQEKPKIYQEIDQEKKPVDGSYVLKGEGEVGFVVAAYDSTKPLVIDPTLIYSTYLGGSNDDDGWGIAVDSIGNAYVTGSTSSANFPTTSGVFQLTSGGGGDAFVTKLSPDGASLIYSTYLGGSNYDHGQGIAVDSSGNAYVTGDTYSPNFPTTAGAFQPTYVSGDSAFVTKLSPGGSSLIYSTYLGGNTHDYGQGIAVDSSGNAYVTGFTYSIDFPTTAGAYQPVKSGSTADAFATKLSPDGSSLVYSTYLGGSNDDHGWGIAVDSSGNAYVTGFASSANFPTTAGVFQLTHGGSYDAFATKLSPDGASLIYSTYLGGSSSDEGYGIAVDSIGNAYVTGFASSANFPTANPYQPVKGGILDAFVTKLSPGGSSLIYSTYLGGSNYDHGQGIAVDSIGSAYVTGYTYSTNFPTANAYQPVKGGTFDAFVTKFSPDGASLIYSTYLGGSNDDHGWGIAVDSNGNAYVTGSTSSANFPTTSGVFQLTSGGGYDAFVTKLGEMLPEVCDGTDNDGDGQIDEGFDVDGDGWTTCDGDCDDTDPAINPDATEVCDGIDNNCNSAVDEGPWPAEICDGLDNNCNGLIDETGCAVVETCNGTDDDSDGGIDEGCFNSKAFCYNSGNCKYHFPINPGIYLKSKIVAANIATPAQNIDVYFTLSNALRTCTSSTSTYPFPITVPALPSIADNMIKLPFNQMTCSSPLVPGNYTLTMTLNSVGNTTIPLMTPPFTLSVELFP